MRGWSFARSLSALARTVPASGAAAVVRMASLARSEDGSAAPVASAIIRSLGCMAFLLALDARLSRGDWRTVPEPALSLPFICCSGDGAVSCCMGFHRPLNFLALALMLAFAAVAGAGDDHARARAAREAGQIVSLRAILDRVEAEFTGSPVEIELDDEDAGHWIYKVKLLAPGGAIVKLEYDARDAKLIRAKGRGADAARRR